MKWTCKKTRKGLPQINLPINVIVLILKSYSVSLVVTTAAPTIHLITCVWSWLFWLTYFWNKALTSPAQLVPETSCCSQSRKHAHYQAAAASVSAVGCKGAVPHHSLSECDSAVYGVPNPPAPAWRPPPRQDPAASELPGRAAIFSHYVKRTFRPPALSPVVYYSDRNWTCGLNFFTFQELFLFEDSKWCPE